MKELTIDIKQIEEGTFEEGGLNGTALDLVQQIINLPGEYYTDEECMRMVHYLANSWSKMSEEGRI